MQPVEFITRLREIYPERYPEMSGGCLKFHLLLKAMYGAKGWYDGDHIISEIDGEYYDIDGVVADAHRYSQMEDFPSQELMSFPTDRHVELIWNGVIH